jgi:hypothetical protein
LFKVSHRHAWPSVDLVNHPRPLRMALLIPTSFDAGVYRWIIRYRAYTMTGLARGPTHVKFSYGPRMQVGSDSCGTLQASWSMQVMQDSENVDNVGEEARVRAVLVESDSLQLRSSRN